MVQDNGQNEGLIRQDNGWVNPLYGASDWWNMPTGGATFLQTGNPASWWHEISQGIAVPRINVSVSSLSDCFHLYQTCSPLQAVCNRIAEALTNGRWRIKNGVGDDVSTDNETNKKIVRLLQRPNPLTVYSTFLKQVSLCLSVYGGAFIYASVPSGFDLINAQNLWCFTPEEVEMEINDKTNFFSAKDVSGIIRRYRITPKNSPLRPFSAKAEHVLFLYDTTETASLIDLTETRPVSGLRIRALKYELRNIMQAQEAIYALNSDRGAQGIVSNEAKDAIGFIPMTPEEKTRIQNRFRSNYGLLRHQDKVFVTDASVKYTPIGFNVKDLMLFEGVRENIMHVCDAYGYPFDLLASEKGKTAADKRTSMAALYQDNIIPLATEISTMLSLWFGLNVDEQFIQIDYSHLNIFQTGNVEKNNSLRLLSQALHILYNGDMVTLEESRRMAGLDPKLPDGTLRSETAAAPARDDVRITTS